MLQLVRPNISYRDSFLAGLQEFQAEGIPWLQQLKVEELRENFSAYVDAQLQKRTTWTKDEPVDETVFWAIVDGTYVGTIAIRHKLNADLRVMGGHIGYETRPSARGRGYASEMLKQALPIAKSLGISEVLVTCNDDNAHSIRVIEKNGGVLKETKLQYEGGPLKRYYWIRL